MSRDQSTIVQHIDGIDIPVIEITDGWAADSVQSEAECNDAFAYLMSACAGIEFQIDMEFSKPKALWDDVWLARAKCALKYKKAALQIVQQRRSAITDAEKRERQKQMDVRLLQHIRASVTNSQFMAWVQASSLGQTEIAA